MPKEKYNKKGMYKEFNQFLIPLKCTKWINVTSEESRCIPYQFYTLYHYHPPYVVVTIAQEDPYFLWWFWTNQRVLFSVAVLYSLSAFYFLPANLTKKYEVSWFMHYATQRQMHKHASTNMCYAVMFPGCRQTRWDD